MSPSADPSKEDGEQNKSGELHVQSRAKGADAVSGKAREKIRTSPGESGEKAEQNSHDALRRLAERGGLAGIARFARVRRFPFFCFEAEDSHDFLQIFPDFGFCAGVAQKICGMIRGH